MGSEIRRFSHVLIGDSPQKMSKQTECITYFSYGCDRKHCDKSHLRKEESV